jgi:hypothetical protein
MFHFVTDGLASALEQARAAAGEQDGRHPRPLRDRALTQPLTDATNPRTSATGSE